MKEGFIIFFILKFVKSIYFS